MLHYGNVVVVSVHHVELQNRIQPDPLRSTRVSVVADLGGDDVRQVQQGGASDGVTHAQAEKRETKQDRLKLVAFIALADRILNLT